MTVEINEKSDKKVLSKYKIGHYSIIIKISKLNAKKLSFPGIPRNTENGQLDLNKPKFIQIIMLIFHD